MERAQAREDRAKRLQLNLLGAVKAEVDGRPIAFRTRKSIALLAYLAVDPGPHPRERLADLLWPEADVVDARASLRTALNYLRQALGSHADSVLVATRDMLGLMPASLQLDVQALTRAQRLARQSPDKQLQHQIESAVERYRGSFLAGMLLPDASEFAAWIEAQRAYWRGVQAELLDRLASLQIEAGESGAALATLERWTAVNPDEELAWQRLIETHLRYEDSAGARRAWHSYRRAIADLDAEPSRQMVELGNRIVAPGSAKQVFGPAAIVTLGGRAGAWKARLLSDFLKSIGSAQADVAQLEKWLHALECDPATVRLELNATIDAEPSAAIPELALAQ